MAIRHRAAPRDDIIENDFIQILQILFATGCRPLRIHSLYVHEHCHVQVTTVFAPIQRHQISLHSSRNSPLIYNYVGMKLSYPATRFPHSYRLLQALYVLTGIQCSRAAVLPIGPTSLESSNADNQHFETLSPRSPAPNSHQRRVDTIYMFPMPAHGVSNARLELYQGRHVDTMQLTVL